MISSAVKISWNRNFANFEDLFLILPGAATGGGIYEIFVKFTGKHLLQSQVLSRNFIKKETLAQRFSFEFCKSFLLQDFSFTSFFLFQRTPLDDCLYFTIIAGRILCNYI